MLPKELRDMLSAKLGREIETSKDCVILAGDIETVTGKTFSETNTKRMFGLTSDKVKTHRGTTMDIIAEYLGFANARELAVHLGDTSGISMFEPFDDVDFDKLSPGDQLVITYEPDRLLTLTYTGDFWFIINESKNSKLQKGDKLRIMQIAKGFELLVQKLQRNGEELGSYRAAKDGGITSIELINPTDD